MPDPILQGRLLLSFSRFSSLHLIWTILRFVSDQFFLLHKLALYIAYSRKRKAVLLLFLHFLLFSFLRFFFNILASKNDDGNEKKEKKNRTKFSH